MLVVKDPSSNCTKKDALKETICGMNSGLKFCRLEEFKVFVEAYVKWILQ
jgi:hypothetical protein